MNIYVSNLSFNIQDEDLKDYFSEFGQVTSVRIITDKLTNRSRGFGFVEMPDEKEALAAIQALDGGVADGRAISVTEAKPREEKKRRFQMN